MVIYPECDVGHVQELHFTGDGDGEPHGASQWEEWNGIYVPQLHFLEDRGTEEFEVRGQQLWTTTDAGGMLSP